MLYKYLFYILYLIPASLAAVQLHWLLHGSSLFTPCRGRQDVTPLLCSAREGNAAQPAQGCCVSALGDVMLCTAPCLWSSKKQPGWRGALFSPLFSPFFPFFPLSPFFSLFPLILPFFFLPFHIPASRAQPRAAVLADTRGGAAQSPTQQQQIADKAAAPRPQRRTLLPRARPLLPARPLPARD